MVHDQCKEESWFDVVLEFPFKFGFTAFDERLCVSMCFISYMYVYSTRTQDHANKITNHHTYTCTLTSQTHNTTAHLSTFTICLSQSHFTITPYSTFIQYIVHNQIYANNQEDTNTTQTQLLNTGSQQLCFAQRSGRRLVAFGRLLHNECVCF